MVYLSTKNLNLPKGRTHKLCPKYIGPYKIFEAYPDSSAYTLQLPIALQQRRIHLTFHISLLWLFHKNNDILFPNRIQLDPYNFRAADNTEWFVDEIVGHWWSDDNSLEYQIRWSQGDTTWEPHSNCNKLQVLDQYLELMGVKYPRQLSRRILDVPPDTGNKRSRDRKKGDRVTLRNEWLHVGSHNVDWVCGGWLITQPPNNWNPRLFHHAVCFLYAFLLSLPPLGQPWTFCTSKQWINDI